MFGLWRPWASLGEQRKWWLVGPCWPLLSSTWKVSRQVRRVQPLHPASRVPTGFSKMATALPAGTWRRLDLSVHTGSRSAHEYALTCPKKGQNQTCDHFNQKYNPANAADYWNGCSEHIHPAIHPSKPTRVMSWYAVPHPQHLEFILHNNWSESPFPAPQNKLSQGGWSVWYNSGNTLWSFFLKMRTKTPRSATPWYCIQPPHEKASQPRQPKKIQSL